MMKTKAISDAIAALEKQDWNRAHEIVQDMTDAKAAWLHGILHMIEGDESNARYWYAQAGRAFPGKDKGSQEIEAMKAEILG
jgi:hypothetical protein